jgi:hypothetical protein
MCCVREHQSEIRCVIKSFFFHRVSNAQGGLLLMKSRRTEWMNGLGPNLTIYTTREQSFIRGPLFATQKKTGTLSKAWVPTTERTEL